MAINLELWSWLPHLLHSSVLFSPKKPCALKLAECLFSDFSNCVTTLPQANTLPWQGWGFWLHTKVWEHDLTLGTNQHCVLLKHSGRTELQIGWVYLQNVVRNSSAWKLFPYVGKTSWELLKIAFSGMMLWHAITFIVEAQSFNTSVLQE